MLASLPDCQLLTGVSYGVNAMKLTSAQTAVMMKMSNTEPKSAYELGCSLATLEALRKKGKVKECSSCGNLGRMFSPRTAIKYLAV